MSIKMIDYNTFTINTNVILLFNNIFYNLFYTIIFINYCNFYKLYIQCWAVGPTRFLSMAHSMTARHRHTGKMVNSLNGNCRNPHSASFPGKISS